MGTVLRIYLTAFKYLTVQIFIRLNMCWQLKLEGKISQIVSKHNEFTNLFFNLDCNLFTMYYRNTPLITPPTIHAYLRMTAFQYYCDSVLANSYIITSPHPMNRARRWYTVVTFLLIILFVLLACIIFEHILFFLKNTFISVCCLLEMFICKK